MVRNNADATNGGCLTGCYTVNLTLPDASNISGTALGDEKMIVYPGQDNVTGCSLSIQNQEKKSIGSKGICKPNN